jgi:NADPH:quinone reductase-like Zn-dependent oxidoreductase
MKAVIYDAYGSADTLRIADIEKPVIGEDEFLVRVRAAAVNPKDVFIRKGRFAQWTGQGFPMQTGFDFAGEVAEVGSKASGLQIGEPVYGLLDGWVGRTCAEFVAVKPNQLGCKPANLSFEEAAALPLASLTALQALRDEAGIRNGSRVCINGASGGVGSMAIQIAKIFGAAVTAVSSAQNHPFLHSLGADECIDYHRSDITQGPTAFDVFFDVFGNRPFDQVQPILTAAGIWVSTVLKAEVFEAVERTKDSTGQRARMVIVFAEGQDLELLCRWAEGLLIKPVIHDIYPLAQIAVAHRQQETKHTRGKLIVRID